MTEPTGAGGASADHPDLSVPSVPSVPSEPAPPDAAASAQPGWYPDPFTPGTQRYWDGSAWQTTTDGSVLPAAPGPGASHRGRTLAVVAAVVVVAVAATVGALAWHNNRESTPVAVATHVSGGTVVTGKGVSVTLPEGWANVPTSPADFQKYLDTAAKSDPNLAKQLSSQNTAATASNLVMLGFRSTADPSGFRTNVNVAVAPAPHMVPAEEVDTVANVLTGIGATSVVTTVEDVSGRSMLVATYDLTIRGVQVHGAQCYVPGDTQAAVLTVSSTGPDAKSLAEAMAATVTVT